MDEKTEELRDIFMDVAEEGTVTESQADDRGSLTDADDAAIDERVAAVVERMREAYAFDTALPTDALVTVVRRFYDGADDAAIAETLAADHDVDADAEAVFAARMDLNLLADADSDLPFDIATLREAREALPDDAGVDALAAELDADPETAARGRRVAETRAAVRRVSGRFQSEFEDAIPDAALAVELTAAAREDGLEEAAEDIETNTKF